MSRLYWYLSVLGALGCVWLGWHFGSQHWKGKYDELVVSDAQASAKSATDAALKARQIQDAYDAKMKGISDAYHKELTASDTAADGLARQLRDYESRLQRCAVPKGSSAPVRAHDPGPEPAGDPGIAKEVGELVKAASADAAKLTALQAERQSLH